MLGLDGATQPPSKQSLVASSSVEPPQSQVVVESQPQGHWGENRLADVVKGTAKSKGSGSSKESSSGGDNDSPRAISPQHFLQCNQTIRQTSIPGPPECKDVATESGDIQLSTVTLTPPSSPEK